MNQAQNKYVEKIAHEAWLGFLHGEGESREVFRAVVSNAIIAAMREAASNLAFVSPPPDTVKIRACVHVHPGGSWSVFGNSSCTDAEAKAVATDAGTMAFIEAYVPLPKPAITVAGVVAQKDVSHGAD